MEQLSQGIKKDFYQGLSGSESRQNRKAVAISMSEEFLQDIDEAVDEHGYPSRSAFVRDVLRGELDE